MSRLPDAIEEAARMLRGDDWQAAFIVAVNGIDPPRIIYANGDRGKATDTRKLTRRHSDDPRTVSASTPGMSFTDAIDAAEVALSDFRIGVGRKSCAAPYEHVVERHERRRDRALDAELERGAYLIEHPHVCPWCSRLGRPGWAVFGWDGGTAASARRFKTARGLAAHLRACRSNPAAWDLTVRVPTFTTSGPLRLAGFFAPGYGGSGDSSEAYKVAVARAVKAAAVGGPDGLPATLAEVPGVPTGGEDDTW